MASTQAGQPPGGGDQNDPNRGPPNEPPSYDFTSTSSSYDSSSGEDLACEGQPEENTDGLSLQERQLRENNAEARAGIRADRDWRRLKLYFDSYYRSLENLVDLQAIHGRQASRRRRARDARRSRGEQYKYDADDEAKRMTREYRRQLRRQGRLLRSIPEPSRDLSLQEVDRAVRDATRDARRSLRDARGRHNEQDVEAAGQRAAEAKRADQQARRLSGQNAQPPTSLPALVENMRLHNTHGAQNPEQSEKPQAPGNFRLATQHPRFDPPPPPRPKKPPSLPRKRKAANDGNKGAPTAKRTRGGKASKSGSSQAQPAETGPTHPDGLAPQGSNVPTGYQSHGQQGALTSTFSQPGSSQQHQQNPDLGVQPGPQGHGHGQAYLFPAGLVPAQPTAGHADPVAAPQPPEQAGGNQGVGGNGGASNRGRGAANRGRGGRGRGAANRGRGATNRGRGAANRGGGARGGGAAGGGADEGEEEAAQVPRPDAWRALAPETHPVLQPYANPNRDDNVHPETLAVQNRVLRDTSVELENADAVIARNNGKDIAQGDPMTPPTPVARDGYTVYQWPDACERCQQHGLSSCNIRQLYEQKPTMNPTPECDNCALYRYDEANFPAGVDHDCRFEPGPGLPLVTAERRNPDGRVVDFVRGLLWQCDHCAREGRYCDVDRLMSVRCTTCQSKGRNCTIRGSPPLRERDYLRALERGFRIMCRLCCKAGKLCSWTDSTENYGSGRPCRQCLPFQEDEQRFGACTTFSKLPVTGLNRGFNPLPMANVLPAVDERGEALMIRQRPPWRNRIPPSKDHRIRRQGNGDIYIYKDPHDPDWTKEDKKKNPLGRKPCEFCYYTASRCAVGTVNRDKACSNCTFLGIKCLSREDLPNGGVATVPRRPREWWNLANGMGYRTVKNQWTNKFKYCTSCVDKKRTCDRKRPCEGCQRNGDQCDPVTWGEGVFVADRHAGDRGHSYYMGLGYGPEGLDTPMLVLDPTHMACGPKEPLENGMPNHKDNDPQGKEQLRAARCHTRETALKERYGDDYLEPGSGQIPFQLDMDHLLPDPTAPVGWPGSFILNDREPFDSRMDPQWRWHPPGIAAYPDVGAEHGAPIPEGLQPGPGHLSPAPQQPAPQQPQQPLNEGGQENLNDAGPVDDFFIPIDGDDDDLDNFFQNYLNLPDIPEAQPPVQGPLPQGQPGQGPPADDDEVMGYEGAAWNEGRLADFDYGVPLEVQPPGMNPFVPIQEEHNPAPAAPSNDPLDVFKLGAAFTRVERFVARRYEEIVLVEDPNAAEPAPGAAGVEPSYPWRVPTDNAPAESHKVAALQRMEYPGNNVLRDIPEEAIDQGSGAAMPCKDRKPPFLLDCDEVDGNGTCENLRHGKEGESVFPVCYRCDMASRWHVFDPNWEGLGGGAGISAKEILMMRAYFCTKCSMQATDPRRWDETGYSMYGFGWAARADLDPAREVGEPGNTVRQGGWKSERPLPVSGCNCMEKLLNRVLCAYHRLFLAQKTIRQAAMMQEYRFRRYGSKICPNCRTQPGLDSTAAPPAEDVQRFWACLVCNGVVASGERGPGRRIESGREVWDWYRNWYTSWEGERRGQGPAWNLEVAAEGEYPPGYSEQDFNIEVRSLNSSDDGEGEVIEID